MEIRWINKKGENDKMTKCPAEFQIDNDIKISNTCKDKHNCKRFSVNHERDCFTINPGFNKKCHFFEAK